MANPGPPGAALPNARATTTSRQSKCERLVGCGLAQVVPGTEVSSLGDSLRPGFANTGGHLHGQRSRLDAVSAPHGDFCYAPAERIGPTGSASPREEVQRRQRRHSNAVEGGTALADAVRERRAQGHQTRGRGEVGAGGRVAGRVEEGRRPPRRRHGVRAGPGVLESRAAGRFGWKVSDDLGLRWDGAKYVCGDGDPLSGACSGG